MESLHVCIAANHSCSRSDLQQLLSQNKNTVKSTMTMGFYLQNSTAVLTTANPLQKGPCGTVPKKPFAGGESIYTHT